MFHVLQEYMTSTEGMCYILGGVLVLLFVPFWMFLNQRDREQ